MQPNRAALTAAISSPIDTLPFPSRSKDGQVSSAARLRAMFTPRINSLMLSSPLSLQSPTHGRSAGMVLVGRIGLCRSRRHRGWGVDRRRRRGGRRVFRGFADVDDTQPLGMTVAVAVGHADGEAGVHHIIGEVGDAPFEDAVTAERQARNVDDVGASHADAFESDGRGDVHTPRSRRGTIHPSPPAESSRWRPPGGRRRDRKRELR